MIRSEIEDARSGAIRELCRHSGAIAATGDHEIAAVHVCDPVIRGSIGGRSVLVLPLAARPGMVADAIDPRFIRFAQSDYV